MSQYSGITAEQARTLSSATPATPEETLIIVESVIGQAAENQQLNSARATLTKTAHTKHGVEAAVVNLTARGFSASLGENGPYYTIDAKW